jgi:tRNA pseudouridine38-40 synthase
MKTRNHKLTIAYDGTPFKGWQVQANSQTIQGRIEHALERCWGEHITLHGSGRTDSGVHANNQIANFKARAKFKTAAALQSALNYHLPPQIRVTQTRYTNNKFHARFSAKGKEYLYRICNHPFQDPFEINRSWHIPRPLNTSEMKKAAQHLTGRHDFASFTNNPGYQRKTTARNITSITLNTRKNIIQIRFRGEGFLYRMVRNLVATLVKVGLGKITPAGTGQILNAKRRSAAPGTAPACGLYLNRVFYTDKF